MGSGRQQQRRREYEGRRKGGQSLQGLDVTRTVEEEREGLTRAADVAAWVCMVGCSVVAR